MEKLNGPTRAAGEAEEQAAGDNDQFVLLFSSERKRIYGFIYSLVPVPADAEDIFQQASLILWRKFSEFDRQKSFYKWACGIAFNLVRNHRRTAHNRRVCFGDNLIEQLAADKAAITQREPEREECLRECLAMLPQKDRNLLSGFYRDSRPVRELAEAAGRNVNTIYNRLSQIRKRLLNCVNNKMASSHSSV